MPRFDTSNSANDCIHALRRCHLTHLGQYDESSGTSLSLLGNGVDTSSPSLDENEAGCKIANQFAHEAARLLSAREFTELLTFLEEHSTTSYASNGEDLSKKLAWRLERFQKEEVQISAQSLERIGFPGGPESAGLGLILHIQSEEDTIGPFWDPRSATIQLLQKKGVSENFTFGYDWHWRAEETFHGRTSCPAKKWSRDLRDVHDAMSRDILTILPLPFLITASSCARENVRKTLGSESRSLEIPIAFPTGILKFDLDYQFGTLRRIIGHIHHPSAGFFASQQTRQSMAAQIDAGLNLFLWILGKPYDPSSFAREYAHGRPHSSKQAPLAEMYAYARKERETDTILAVQEYAPPFLSWVYRYTGQDPALISLRGESIAGTAIKKIGENISIARHRDSTKTTKTAHSASSLQEDISNHCEGPFDKFIVSNNQILHGYPEAAFTKPTPKSHQGIETDIPEPYGDREIEEEAVDNEAPYSQSMTWKNYSCVTFHGKSVVLLACGKVKLVDSTGNEVLGFRMNTRTAKNILELGSNPSIKFSNEEISLWIGDKSVYNKPIERLLASPEGPQWLIQVMNELEYLHEAQLAATEKARLSSVCQRSLVPRPNSNSGTYWKHGELQRKLDQGSYFQCRPLTNGTKMGRVCIRGVQILVPEEANFETVFIQCELAPLGSQHKNKCGTDLEHEDPANRLGIRVRFNSKVDSEEREIWAALGGTCNAKKLNSLVDFIEGMDDDWTAQQPRRFLDRNKGKGRMSTTYT